MDSAVTADTVTNTFTWVSAGEPSSGQFDTVRDAIKSFYSSLKPYMTPAINWAAVRMVTECLDDVKPRVARRDETVTVTGTEGTDPGPAELAICLSFRKTPASGTNPRRRRGRVYLGPWSASNVGGARPSHTLASVILGAASTLDSAISGIGSGWYLAIGHADESAGYDIDEFYVDDAWDIQRRRGLKPSTKWTS